MLKRQSLVFLYIFYMILTIVTNVFSNKKKSRFRTLLAIASIATIVFQLQVTTISARYNLILKKYKHSQFWLQYSIQVNEVQTSIRSQLVTFYFQPETSTLFEINYKDFNQGEGDLINRANALQNLAKYFMFHRQCWLQPILHLFVTLIREQFFSPAASIITV